MNILSLSVDGALGFLIGMTLGFLGGGGSILTVPVLVYIVGQDPHAAVTASLMIVGANAALGGFFHRMQGALDWRVALLFGGVGMVAAYLASGLSKLMSPTVLLILFALLMLVVGAWMLFSKPPIQVEVKGRGWLVTALSGAGVGVLTGILGVGGGFLIVPALVMFVGLPMRKAVGTSLVVIALNSLAGILGHLNGAAMNWAVIGIFVLAGLAGNLVGVRLTRVVKPDQLRASFAGFVVLLALFLLYDNLPKIGWRGSRR
jgi:uncharacterized protein